MKRRAINPYSPEEIRRALMSIDSEIDADVALFTKDIQYLQSEIDTLESEIGGGGGVTVETDDAVAPGQPVYIKSNGHLALACASALVTSRVAGLSTTTTAATNAATYQTEGKLTLMDWTAATGSTSLTPGSEYYLQWLFTTPDPEYTNTGGTGNRTAEITVSCDTNISIHGSISAIVDGNSTSGGWWMGVSGIFGSSNYLRFDFGSGALKQITEATWYQDSVHDMGTWQWQGSNDATSWANLGSTFNLCSSTATQVMSIPNSDGYRYYQMAGVSGAPSNVPYVYEVTFKIADWFASTGVGMMTPTAPTTIGQCVVSLGRALTTQTFSIEIEQPILL